MFHFIIFLQARYEQKHLYFLLIFKTLAKSEGGGGGIVKIAPRGVVLRDVKNQDDIYS